MQGNKTKNAMGQAMCRGEGGLERGEEGELRGNSVRDEQNLSHADLRGRGVGREQQRAQNKLLMEEDFGTLPRAKAKRVVNQREQRLYVSRLQVYSGAERRGSRVRGISMNDVSLIHGNAKSECSRVLSVCVRVYVSVRKDGAKRVGVRRVKIG